MSILMDMLNDESKALSSRQVMLIDPNDIEPNELNNAPMSDIDVLIESIKEKGQTTPIIVYRLGNHHYKLLSGERRWSAFKKAQLGMMEAVIIDKPSSEALERFYILTMNSQRDFTKEYKESRIAEYDVLYDELEIKGIRKREWISQHVGFQISPRTVQNYLSEEKECSDTKKSKPKKLSAVTKQVQKLVALLSNDFNDTVYDHKDLVELDDQLSQLFQTIPQATAIIYKMKQANYEQAEAEEKGLDDEN